MHNPNNQRYFAVEGNIGAGKSTFLAIIKKYLNVQITFEPLEQWQNVGNYNLLELFYSDSKRWAYTFMSYAFMSILRQKKQKSMQINSSSIRILERSVFAHRHCFVKNCYELGYINALEWKLYQELFSGLTTKASKIDGFIYLRTDPSVCYQRLMKRDRKEELVVSYDYLKRLHEKHDRWLIEKEGVLELEKDIPILILDCNIDFELDNIMQEKLIEQVGTFLTLSMSQSTSHISEKRSISFLSL